MIPPSPARSPWSTPEPPPASDAGYSTPEAILVVAVLLSVVMLLSALPTIPERQHVARAAAAEGARAAALVSDPDNGAAVAQATAVQVAANYGIPGDEIRVSLDGTVDRGESIDVHATVALPAIRFPGVGTLISVEWTASASERVEDYRSFDR